MLALGAALALAGLETREVYLPGSAHRRCDQDSVFTPFDFDSVPSCGSQKEDEYEYELRRGGQIFNTALTRVEPFSLEQ